jgi:hypothetical protein
MYCCSGYVVMCLQSVLLCDLMLTHVLHYRGRGGERPGVPTGMLATVCEWALDVGFQTVCEQDLTAFARPLSNNSKLVNTLVTLKKCAKLVEKLEHLTSISSVCTAALLPQQIARRQPHCSVPVLGQGVRGGARSQRTVCCETSSCTVSKGPSWWVP